MPKFTKYLWLLFGLSLCAVFFGHLCTLNMIAAGVLLFFYGIYAMGEIGILPRSNDDFSNTWAGYFLFAIIGIILYQFSKLLTYCGCWPE